jgi:hypothetical protein
MEPSLLLLAHPNIIIIGYAIDLDVSQGKVISWKGSRKVWVNPLELQFFKNVAVRVKKSVKALLGLYKEADKSFQGRKLWNNLDSIRIKILVLNMQGLQAVALCYSG